MRLVLLPLLLISLTLTAQVSTDSILRQTQPGQQILTEKDTVQKQINQFRTKADSLRPSPKSLLDSTQIARYVQAQQDSLQGQKQRLQAMQDSLLSPLDTLEQRLSQKANAVRDTLYQKVPVQKAVEGVEAISDVTAPDELTHSLPNTDLARSVPSLPIEKVAPELPSMPQPVHAVQEHTAAWQEKLSQHKSSLSQHQGKVTQYTTPLQQGGQALEQQALQQTPGGELLQQNHQALEAWQGEQALTAEEQQAQMQEKLLSTAQDHFANHSEALHTAQGKLQDLKKKYKQVQTDQDLYMKKSSLEGEPFGERLTYGGTMQVLTQPQLAFDVSPLLGYRFNKRFTLGVGATYRLALSKNPVSVVTENATYGCRAYAEYNIIRSFLLHGEYERMSQAAPAPGQDDLQRSWQTSLLVGVGKTYRITNKLQGSILFLYNLRHDKQTVYPRPFMIRAGFQVVGAK